MGIASIRNTSKERARTLLTVGAKLPKLNFYRVVDFLYQVSPESFKIGSSKQEITLAGWTEK